VIWNTIDFDSNHQRQRQPLWWGALSTVQKPKALEREPDKKCWFMFECWFFPVMLMLRLSC